MKYTILHDNPTQPLMERLLHIRNIDCDVDAFFNPKMSHYRIDPFLLDGMQVAIDRIMLAIQNKERIMIFGDYDVDGVTSSYSLFNFFQKYLGYKNISIMYPHRRHDGYGIKNKHIDVMKEKKIGLIITVDNGITSIAESKYAKELGIDMIITDHHERLPELPDAIAVINPHVSSNYDFKGICGAVVAFKLINAIMTHLERDKETKKIIFENYLPIMALATVADCVPLVHENRCIVNRGLQLINKGQMPASMAGFIKFLKIKGPLKTFHFGFLLGPRINAGGRIRTPYDSLNVLINTGAEQIPYLEKLEKINTERKQLQEDALTFSKENLNTDNNLIFSVSKEYNEGIVGIVAGRLTEEHYKPSVILGINEETQQASGSLRAPPYFNVIKMLHDKNVSQWVERSGGHKQAGGLTVKLENLENLEKALHQHCIENIDEKDLERDVTVDTILSEQDITDNHLADIEKIGPFGVGNPEPLFLLKDVTIIKTEKVGRKGKGHVKLHIQHGKHKIQAMFWSKGDVLDTYLIGKADLIGNIREDTYNGGWMLIGKYYIDKNTTT